MKISLLSPMRCHHFDLAAELEQRKVPVTVYTAYPRWKLKHEALSQTLIHTFPWVFTPKLALPRLGLHLPSLDCQLDWWSRKTLDHYLRHKMSDCDIFESLSSYAIKTGQAVQAAGGHYITHRGSAHIDTQSELLRDEYQRWGFEWPDTDPRIVNQERAEYDAADYIHVPSRYVAQTFEEKGLPKEKILCLPYGADLSGFHPTSEPDPHKMTILFAGQVSLRKGFMYLLRAFQNFQHPYKRLIVIGDIEPAVQTLLEKETIEHVTFLGRTPRVQLKQWMSQSDVMVLPSIEDGFGKVLSEAMACGCPIICSENTGGPGYIESGKEGFIVPIRDTHAITHCFEALADDTALSAQMRHNALEKIQTQGGWAEYTNQYLQLCERIKRNIQ